MAETREASEPQPRNDRIREFVLGHFPLAGQLAPGDDDPLLESGVIDSLGILEVVNFLTAEFGIEVSDEDLLPENFNTINSLAAFVRRKDHSGRGA